MPMTKLMLKPGVNTLATQTQAEGTWSSTNLIRWRVAGDGQVYVEKYMGWARLSSSAITGTGRSLHAWADLAQIKYLAIGTSQLLQLYTGTTLSEITPVRKTNDLVTAFTTTNGSTTVTVTDTSHGAGVNDRIVVLSPTAIGGLVLSGSYTIVTVPTANTYTITAASAATSAAGPAGTVPSYATTAASTTVTVTLTAHGYSINTIFTVQVPVTVGGLTLAGDYVILTVTANTFTFATVAAATSTASASENSGNIRIQYLLQVGNVSGGTAQGYGTGVWGKGTWGNGDGGTVITNLRIWSLDNFGQNLIASPTDGALYNWVPPSATNNRAIVIPSPAPQANSDAFVAMPQAQVIALGSETGGIRDRLLIRWSDTGNYLQWIASATNQTGSFRLSRGSQIVGGIAAQLAIFVWTDTDLWQMQYQGPPFIYSFSIVSNATGLIGKRARCAMGRDIYWMSLRGFYKYGMFASQVIPCPVWDTIFTNLNANNTDKIIAAPNTALNEIAWFYPSNSGSGEIDSYVKLNILSGIWDYGSLVRTAWLDVNVFGLPLGIDSGGLIQQHETGYDNDTAAMTGTFAQTGYIDLAEGKDLVFCDRIIPDFTLKGTSPSVKMTIYATAYPNQAVATYGPYTISGSTNIVPFRARARQIAFRIQDDGALNTWWRLGAVRVRLAPAGRR